MQLIYMGYIYLSNNIFYVKLNLVFCFIKTFSLKTKDQYDLEQGLRPPLTVRLCPYCGNQYFRLQSTNCLSFICISINSEFSFIEWGADFQGELLT